MQAQTLGVQTAAEANDLGRIGRRGDPAVYMAEHPDETLGRWPANLILDADAAAGVGAVARYFYCPKVSRAEREFGCDDLPMWTAGEMTGDRAEGSAGLNNPRAGAGRGTGSRNAHPTVKPIALMRWLVRLVTPPGGTIVDPFVGSGSTAIAAMFEKVGFMGVDLEGEWLAVANARVRAWHLQRDREATDAD